MLPIIIPCLWGGKKTLINTLISNNESLVEINQKIYNTKQETRHDILLFIIKINRALKPPSFSVVCYQNKTTSEKQTLFQMYWAT